MGKLRKGSGPIAMLHSEMEAAATDISVEVLSEASKAPDSAARRRVKMIRGLAGQYDQPAPERTREG